MIAGLRLHAERCDDTTGTPAPSSLLLRCLVAILTILFALSLHRAFIANINWDEFWNVVKGNGPCNKQRLDHHKKYHDEGKLVRECAQAYHEKSIHNGQK